MPMSSRSLTFMSRRQIENRLEQRLRAMASEGVDPRKLNIDWTKVKRSASAIPRFARVRGVAAAGQDQRGGESIPRDPGRRGSRGGGRPPGKQRKPGGGGSHGI